jgi:hypothetical protein
MIQRRRSTRADRGRDRSEQVVAINRNRRSRSSECACRAERNVQILKRRSRLLHLRQPLQAPGILAVIRQLIPAGVAQHVPSGDRTAIRGWTFGGATKPLAQECPAIQNYAECRSYRRSKMHLIERVIVAHKEGRLVSAVIRRVQHTAALVTETEIALRLRETALRLRLDVQHSAALVTETETALRLRETALRLRLGIPKVTGPGTPAIVSSGIFPAPKAAP